MRTAKCTPGRCISRYRSAIGTRVAVSTDGRYTNTWQNGDEVGGFIKKRNQIWVDNMEMTYNDGSWSYTLPEGHEYYPQDETLSFYAYYPYRGSFQMQIALDVTNYRLDSCQRWSRNGRLITLATDK